MFASAGSLLKLHAISEQRLEPIAVYKPKKPSGSRITNLTWCHDNTYLALLQENSFPQIVSSKDRSNIELVHTIQALKNVSAIKFKQHTKRIMALGNSNGEAILYDTKNRITVKKLCELNSPVRSIEFNNTDQQLAVCTEKSITLFVDHDNNSNSFLKATCYPESCTFVKYHPVLRHVLGLAYDNGSVELRDTEKEDVVIHFQKHSAPVTGINFSGTQKAVITTGLDKKICICDYSNGECVFRINIHQAITCSDISVDDVCIAVGLEDGSISIYDIRDPLKPLMSANAHNCAVTNIAFEKTPFFIETSPGRLSGITLVDSNLGDHSEEVKILYELENKLSDEKLKQDIVKMIKTHTDYMDAQLLDHCMKFQSFITNEFDSIQKVMSRWNVFNIEDELASIEMRRSEPKSLTIKTSINH